MRKTLIAILLALVLTLSMVVPVFAAPSDDITITATPVFISIVVAPDTWTINDGGDDLIRKDTEYYATDTNDTTPPNSTVVDADCLFAISNNSTVATDITLTCEDFTGGDAWTNAESKSNGAGIFAMLSYFTGDTWVDFATSGVIVKTAATGSSVGHSNLAALTGIEFGIGFDSPTDDALVGGDQTGIITVSAAEHT